MDTRFLKSLIAVVDSGSIADAARVEHLTAAAVGQRVQALERELGFALLSRHGHTARPTEACLALLPRARRMVREASLLRGDIDRDGLSGTLTIGAISTALTGMLPAALQEFTRKAPRARPVIVPGTSKSLFQSLQTGELDAAIVVGPPFALPKTLSAVTLRTEPLLLLAGRQTRGSAAKLLATQPYIRYDPNAWGGRHAAAWIADHGIEPTVLCDLDALEAIAMLVSGGMGVGLVPRWPGIERFTEDCRVTPLAGAAYQRDIVLVSNRDADRPNLIAILTQALTHSRKTERLYG
ncbi:LysR family transcriptional regulator [Burkholderia multivorans]|uniref:LysR substrate-binding domain-containing protein n=1 Tax=Burkholderia multivorans TaxID=87883 RepID=UPI000CFEC638|nr:LysR substrate-binding domain-containing protein [Burkholderia multivorans]MBU9366044.1 LysR family transcriptional regulator [Burkholderia multivorans]PRG77668.1 LysR family transcriptional regulator [Burkholderia multivorans]